MGRASDRLHLVRPAGRARWQSRAKRFFADHDVLITPVLAKTPPAARDWYRYGWTRNFLANLYAPFPSPWNLAGWPALSVPAGFHSNGMPIGVQLVAQPGGEQLLLSVAAAIERVRPWRRLA